MGQCTGIQPTDKACGLNAPIVLAILYLQTPRLRERCRDLPKGTRDGAWGGLAPQPHDCRIRCYPPSPDFHPGWPRAALPRKAGALLGKTARVSHTLTYTQQVTAKLGERWGAGFAGAPLLRASHKGLCGAAVVRGGEAGAQEERWPWAHRGCARRAVTRLPPPEEAAIILREGFPTCH